MEKLFLSSRNLAAAPLLGTGKLDLSEALSKLQAAEHPNVSFEWDELPRNWSLQWSEFATPRTHTAPFDALLGAKMHSYKFQYLGAFLIGDQPIPCKDWGSEDGSRYEHFYAETQAETAHDTALEGTGACNCTWLIDFIFNAGKIAADPNRQETFSWKRAGDNLVLQLTAFYPDHTEFQEFIFRLDLSAMKWQHRSVYI